ALERLLELERGFAVETRVLEGRQTDPLRSVDRPDLLLLHVGSGSVEELDALSTRPTAERPPIVVIGDTGHAESMRAAMRAGARDFLPEPVSEEELKASIGRMLAEQTAPRSSRSCQMTAFINAKG